MKNIPGGNPKKQVTRQKGLLHNKLTDSGEKNEYFRSNEKPLKSKGHDNLKSLEG